MRESPDAAEAETQGPLPEHAGLRKMLGRWRGECLLSTWGEPALERSVVDVRVVGLSGNRLIRMDYQGTGQAGSHAGLLLVGFFDHVRSFEVSWADSVHTGTSVVSSSGPERPDGVVSVLGSFGDEGRPWGWRCVLALDGADRLVFEAYTISSLGREERAVAACLERV